MLFIELLCYLKAELLALDPQSRDWASLLEAFMLMEALVREDKDPACRWTSGQVFVDKNLGTFGFCEHSRLGGWEIHVPLKVDYDDLEAMVERLQKLSAKQPW